MSTPPLNHRSLAYGSFGSNQSALSGVSVTLRDLRGRQRRTMGGWLISDLCCVKPAQRERLIKHLQHKKTVRRLNPQHQGRVSASEASRGLALATSKANSASMKSPHRARLCKSSASARPSLQCWIGGITQGCGVFRCNCNSLFNGLGAAVPFARQADSEPLLGLPNTSRHRL